MYVSLSAPVMVQLELTSRCNQQCLHCYNYWRSDTDYQSWPERSEGKIIRRVLDEICDSGVLSVVLTGGEPLMEKEVLKEASAYLGERGILYSVNSNLTLLSPSDARHLRACGVQGVLTTILGDSAELHDSIVGRRGSYWRVRRGIEILQAEGIEVAVNMVVNAHNRHAIRAVGSMVAEECNVGTFCATKASPPVSSDGFSDLALSPDHVLESLDDMNWLSRSYPHMSVHILECYPLCLHGDSEEYTQYSRRSCRAGVTGCAISPSGYMRPCAHSDMVYGNVVAEGLRNVWNYMEDWRSGEYIPDTCKSCARLWECSAGCRMEAKHYGDISAKDPYMKEPFSDPRWLDEEIDSIAPDDVFWTRAALCYRPEEFGGIVFTSTGDVLLLNSDGLRFMKYVSSLEYFTCREVSEAKGIDLQRTTSFLAVLVKHNLVQKGGDS